MFLELVLRFATQPQISAANLNPSFFRRCSNLLQFLAMPACQIESFRLDPDAHWLYTSGRVCMWKCPYVRVWTWGSR